MAADALDRSRGIRRMVTLYVREACCTDWGTGPIYKADDPTGRGAREAGYQAEPKYKSSIHMPRRASRLTLEVTSTKIEPLIDLSWDDALAEGIATTSKDDG